MQSFGLLPRQACAAPRLCTNRTWPCMIIAPLINAKFSRPCIYGRAMDLLVSQLYDQLTTSDVTEVT
jgi:hypothetical protein